MKKKAIGCLVSVVITIIGVRYAGEIRTSPAGLALIGNAEGCRRDPYICPAGVLTAGIGSTGDIRAGHRYSDDEIAARWADDLARAERCIDRNFNGGRMNQGQFDAMASAAFNLGCMNLMWFTNRQGIRQRTTIWRMAQAERWPEMCARLVDFDRAAGKVLPGLVQRRQQEKSLCLAGGQP